MEVANIEILKLYVSNINVRKTLTSEEDETGITDLANDISTNGLINPITVRLNNDKYEIIAGQRRYLAMKQLNKTHIPCNILNIDTQKAEEISLVEKHLCYHNWIYDMIDITPDFSINICYCCLCNVTKKD